MSNLFAIRRDGSRYTFHGFAVLLWIPIIVGLMGLAVLSFFLILPIEIAMGLGRKAYQLGKRS